MPIDFKVKDPTQAQEDYDLSAKMMGPPAKSSIYADGNTMAIFSCSYDKFNRLSAAIAEAGTASPDQLFFSREDCRDRLYRMFSRIAHGEIIPASSAISVGGLSFDLHSFLITRNSKPVICFEYMCRLIGGYELSISMTYNNETQRLKMCRCLDESTFG